MKVELFHYSEQVVQKLKRTFLLMAIVIPLALFLFVQIGPLRGLLDTGVSLIASAAIFVLTAILFALIYRSRYNLIKKTEITLTEEGLEHRLLGQTEKYPYHEINRLIIHTTRRGETILLELQSAQKSLAIAGFENMERLSSQLAGRLSNEKQQRKQHLLDLRHPLALPLMMLLMFVVLALLFQLIDLQLLNIIILTLMGLSFLFGKSKFPGLRPRARRLELTFGLGAIGLGVFNLAVQVSLGALNGPCSFIGKYIEQSGCVYASDDGSSVAFMPNSQTIAWNDARAISLEPMTWWGWSRRQLLRHDDFLAGFALSPDGALLASWFLTRDASRELWL